MSEFVYDPSVWRNLKIARDFALADPKAHPLDWMICRTSSITAWQEGHHFVVYDREFADWPMSYGGNGDIDHCLHICVRGALDSTEYALAKREPFMTDQGALRAIHFTDAMDLIRTVLKSTTEQDPPPASASGSQ